MSSFRLLNFLAYQLAWFACVLGAAHDLAWAGAAFALAVTAVHLALRLDASELRLVVCAAAIGFLVDSVLVRAHFVEFASTSWDGWAPFWMVSLWMAFATTLNHSLRWLSSRPWVATLFGAMGGPLAYFAGAKTRRADARHARFCAGSRRRPVGLRHVASVPARRGSWGGRRTAAARMKLSRIPRRGLLAPCGGERRTRRVGVGWLAA